MAYVHPAEAGLVRQRGSCQCDAHAPTTAELFFCWHLLHLGSETQAIEDGSSTRFCSISIDFHHSLVNLGKTSVVGFGVSFGSICIDIAFEKFPFLLDELCLLYISAQHAIDDGRVVTSNLLLDVENLHGCSSSRSAKCRSKVLLPLITHPHNNFFFEVEENVCKNKTSSNNLAKADLLHCVR